MNHGIKVTADIGMVSTPLAYILRGEPKSSFRIILRSSLACARVSGQWSLVSGPWEL